MPALPGGFTDEKINTGEVEIAYSVGPDNGPTLLLLHGLSDRRDAFPTVIETLVQTYRVVTIDQRGHGESGHTPGQYQVADYARDVLFILQNVCMRPTVIWGHSLGGANAAATAIQHPTQLQGLVLEDPAVFGRSRRAVDSAVRQSPFQASLELVEADISLEEMATRISLNEPGMPDYYATWKAERLLQMDVSILRDVVAGNFRGGGNPVEDLAAIKVPVLLLQADPEIGGIIPDDFLAEITPKSGDWTVVKMEGAGHVINRNHPEMTLPVVLPWLESHS